MNGWLNAFLHYADGSVHAPQFVWKPGPCLRTVSPLTFKTLPCFPCRRRHRRLRAERRGPQQGARPQRAQRPRASLRR
jgi:hypothetical protein